MNELWLELPWPPSVNNYKKPGRLRRTKKGKLYQPKVNTEATKKFYFDVYIISKKSVPSEWGKFSRSKEIQFGVDIWQHPPDNRVRDNDNFVKVLLDALVRAKVVYDDSLITRQMTDRLATIKNGKVVVKLFPRYERMNRSQREEFMKKAMGVNKNQYKPDKPLEFFPENNATVEEENRLDAVEKINENGMYQ